MATATVSLSRYLCRTFPTDGWEGDTFGQKVEKQNLFFFCFALGVSGISQNVCICVYINKYIYNSCMCNLIVYTVLW